MSTLPLTSLERARAIELGFIPPEEAVTLRAQLQEVTEQRNAAVRDLSHIEDMVLEYRERAGVEGHVLPAGGVQQLVAELESWKAEVESWKGSSALLEEARDLLCKGAEDRAKLAEDDAARWRHIAFTDYDKIRVASREVVMHWQSLQRVPTVDPLHGEPSSVRISLENEHAAAVERLARVLSGIQSIGVPVSVVLSENLAKMTAERDAQIAVVDALTEERIRDVTASFEKLKATEAERDSALALAEARFDCHGGPGTTKPACRACASCLTNALESVDGELKNLVAAARKCLHHVEPAIGVARMSTETNLKALADGALVGLDALHDAIVGGRDRRVEEFNRQTDAAVTLELLRNEIAKARAAAHEEQRETDARIPMELREKFGVGLDMAFVAEAIRAAPLALTPLADMLKENRRVVDSEFMCSFCKKIDLKTNLEAHITTCEEHPLFKRTRELHELREGVCRAIGDPLIDELNEEIIARVRLLSGQLATARGEVDTVLHFLRKATKQGYLTADEAAKLPEGRRLAIMYSEPQTIICNTKGQGIAITYGNTRAEREANARYLVACANGELPGVTPP